MKLILALAFLSSAPIWAADPTALDIKTGEWEYTVSMQMAGMPQAHAAQMPQIPPEQLQSSRPNSAQRSRQR